MKKSYISDMTKGSELKLLIGFTIPMLLGNIFQQFYNMVDSIIVGKYVGANALGSVGSVGSIVFLFFSLCMGLGAGLGVLLAQSFGRKDTEKVKKIIGNSIYITLISGVIMSLFCVSLASPLLKLMNTPKANFKDAYDYMVIVGAGTIIVAIYNMISAILRSLGDSKTPLIFLIVSCFFNIVLDLLFVIKFNMGVKGTAYATVIAQFIAASGSILFGIKTNPYLRLKKKHFNFDKKIIKDGCKLGIPMAAQFMLISLSCVVLQSVVNKFGSTAMAAFTATGRVEQLVQQPFNSLGTAISTFAGQNIGAKKYKRVNTGVKKSIQLISIFSLFMIIIMFTLGKPIVGIFVSNPEVIEIGATGLRISSIMYIGLGFIYIMRGTLNGIGDSGFAMVNGILEVIGRVLFAWILMQIPGVGIWAIWYTNVFTWLLTGGMNWWRYQRVVHKNWLGKVLTTRQYLCDLGTGGFPP